MGRLRDHRPRFDATVCPDRAACVRLYHPTLEYGDQCECCGDLVAAESAPPPGYLWSSQAGLASFRITGEGFLR